MKPIPGTNIYIPDSETHLLESPKPGAKPFWNDYQKDRLDAAYRHVKDWNVAIDVGAHVGLLTRQLAKKFTTVHAFEPSFEAFECLKRNTEMCANVQLHHSALGSFPGAIGLQDVTGNTGNRQVMLMGCGAWQITLDSLHLLHCDLIKIDVQGYELQVLRGAEKTIKAYGPVMIVEMEPLGKLTVQINPPEAAAKLLKSWGAVECHKRINADRIYKFPSER